MERRGAARAATAEPTQSGSSCGNRWACCGMSTMPYPSEPCWRYGTRELQARCPTEQPLQLVEVVSALGCRRCSTPSPSRVLRGLLYLVLAKQNPGADRSTHPSPPGRRVLRERHRRSTCCCCGAPLLFCCDAECVCACLYVVSGSAPNRPLSHKSPQFRRFWPAGWERAGGEGPALLLISSEQKTLLQRPLFPPRGWRR